jgi:hypothetical protein
MDKTKIIVIRRMAVILEKFRSSVPPRKLASQWLKDNCKNDASKLYSQEHEPVESGDACGIV